MLREMWLEWAGEACEWGFGTQSKVDAQDDKDMKQIKGWDQHCLAIVSILSLELVV